MSISAMNTELFIMEMMVRPAIWKSKHPQHRFKNVVKRLWMEIHNKFPDFPVVDLKKKWKNLKDTYRKELKKNPQAYSDPSGLYQSQWIHFQALEFLKNECMPSVAGEGEGTAEEEENNNEDHSSASEHEAQENETTHSAPASPAVRYTPTRQPTNSIKPENSNKRKFNMREDLQTEHLEIEKKKLKILEREMNKQPNVKKTDNYYFLMSILPEMDKLHPIQKFRLRNNINQALMEEITLSMYGDPLETGQPAAEEDESM